MANSERLRAKREADEAEYERISQALDEATEKAKPEVARILDIPLADIPAGVRRLMRPQRRRSPKLPGFWTYRWQTFQRVPWTTSVICWPPEAMNRRYAANGNASSQSLKIFQPQTSAGHRKR
ncbi:hypothetical protein AO282_08235 [Pseudomonas amygdali pv. morsprunorum]|nr:hypothetical protein AO282_08235 [Pseudomonas amygdali pv. morsprunorum]